MRGMRKELWSTRRPASGSAIVVPAGRNGITPDEWAVRLAGGVTYVPTRWLSRLLVAVHFRRPTVRHRDRFPARGPVLLVANHPATWTDVIVLESAFSRRLHFLAQERLFHPLPRAWILWMHGALPVMRREDAPDHADRNQATFRRCRELLARGEVVAIFPEGLSRGDRAVGECRTGAARIALDSLLAGTPVAVVPVGIHYEDRTTFRSEVVVQVGRPLHAEAEPADQARAGWVERMTTTIRMAIEGLIVQVSPSERPWVEELAPLLAAGRDGDPGAFRRSRILVRRLRSRRRWKEGGPWEKRVRQCARLRSRLGIAYRDLDSISCSKGRQATLVAGALPAFAGVLFHAVPGALTDWSARRHRDPERTALARIVAGLVWFVTWYVAAGILVARLTERVSLAIAFLAIAAGFGWIAILWSDSWPDLRGRLRTLRLERRHPAAVSRLRRERDALRGWLES